MSVTLAESRSLKIFLGAVNEYHTKRSYIYWLNRYLADSGKQSYDDLIKDPPEKIQTDLENYALMMQDVYPLSTVRLCFSALFLFFGMNRVLLNTLLIKKLFPKGGQIPIGGRAYTKQEIRKILDVAKSFKRNRKRNIALIHLLATSGIRLGVIDSLKVKHVKKIHDCYSVAVYAGSAHEYHTFIAPRAAQALDLYLVSRQDLTEEAPLFEFESRENVGPYQSKDARSAASRSSIGRLVKKAGIVFKPDYTIEDKDGKQKTVHSKRFNAATAHAFRKYFATTLKNNQRINPNAIEKMLGHSGLVDLDKEYYKPTVNELFSEYQKGISALEL